MSKVPDVFMLGYSSEKLIAGAMLESIPKGTLCDLGFPGNSNLKTLAHRYGWRYMKMRNEGTAANWMKFWSINKPDILIGIEPDERASDPNWCAQVTRVMCANERLGYVGMGQAFYSPMYDYLLSKRWTSQGIALKTYSEAPGWAMGAFSGRFIKEVGIKSDPFYGSLEALTAQAMAASGWKWALLDGVFSKHLYGPEPYEKWKDLRADRRTDLSFDTWLKTQA